MKLAILDKGVFWLTGVVLQFIITPAMNPLLRIVIVKTIAKIEVLFRTVDFFAFEFITPNQFPINGVGLECD